jgi:hypothetical protein
MAIDTQVFYATLAPGTYPANVPIPMTAIVGSGTVRSGFGPARLKRITRLATTIGGSAGDIPISFQNSSWDQPLFGVTPAAGVGVASSNSLLDEHASLTTDCNSAPLALNSVNTVTIVPQTAITILAGNATDVYVLVDIDYPNIGSVVDPDALTGFPQSNQKAISAVGTIIGSGPVVFQPQGSFDDLKDNRGYFIKDVSLISPISTINFPFAFVKIYNASSQRGLVRVIPIPQANYAIKYRIKYIDQMVKGPYNIDIAVPVTSTATLTAILNTDYVSNRNGAFAG